MPIVNYLLWLLLSPGPWLESDNVLQPPKDGKPGIGLREESDMSPLLQMIIKAASKSRQQKPKLDIRENMLVLNTTEEDVRKEVIDNKIYNRFPDGRLEWCVECNKGPDPNPAKTRTLNQKRLGPDPGLRKPDPSSDGPGVKKSSQEKEYRPPRDIAADRIDETAKTRPIFTTKNQIEVAKMANELGKPVIWWSFWPDTYDTTAAYFNELSEVQHLLMTNEQIRKNNIEGQEWIVYRHKDGEDRWIKGSEVFGQQCAVELRKAWKGPSGPAQANGSQALSKNMQPQSLKKQELTDRDKEAILAFVVPIRLRTGAEMESMSLGEAISRGYQLSYSDGKALERKGFNEQEVAFVVSRSRHTDNSNYVVTNREAYNRSAVGSSYSGTGANYYGSSGNYYSPYRTDSQRPQARSSSMPMPQMSRSFAGPIRGG